MLLTPSQFRDLVSGRRRGAAAAMLRCGLRLAEVPYTWAVARRNRRYDRGAAAVERVGVPVVSVGNLTLGGTGKTPLVAWIARWMSKGDSPVFADTKTGTVPGRVAIISRGYGAKAGEANDEALELKQKLPDVPHLQNPDRVAAARQAIAEFGCQAIVLDDGFQHRRIARDLDIVLLDALEPFGFGHVFPRGTLREPLAGLRRAHVVALSRADMLDPPQREAIRRRVAQLAPQAGWLEIAHAARGLVAADGREASLDTLRDKPVAAFCGLGNPAGFRHTLAACGYRVVGFREFPDHHRYTPADLDELAAWAAGLDVAAVLCTQKDIVKLAGLLSVGQVANLPSQPVGATVALSPRGGSATATPTAAVGATGVSPGATGVSPVPCAPHGQDARATLNLWAVRVEIDFLAGQQVLEDRLRAL